MSFCAEDLLPESMLRANFIVMPDPVDRRPPWVTLESLYGEETAEWMRLSPQERWKEMTRLAGWFDALGGTSDPDPDPSSPFYDPSVRRLRPIDGRTGVRVVRRGGV
jgi:hypothetical protein